MIDSSIKTKNLFVEQFKNHLNTNTSIQIGRSDFYDMILNHFVKEGYVRILKTYVVSVEVEILEKGKTLIEFELL